METWPKGLISGTVQIDINGKKEVDLSELVQGPGYYQFAWVWLDDRGNIMTVKQYAMVYTTGQPLPGHQVMQADMDKAMYEPGDSIHANVLTGLSDAPGIIQTIERRASAYKRDWINNPTSNLVVATIKEEDRGGLQLNYMTVYNNRFYRHQQTIVVPWTNKELDVQLKTWRDKLEPGDEENWTITVAGKKGDAVTAEMLLSMYDASLDAFIPHQWSMNLFPTFYSRMSIEGSEERAEDYWGLSYHWDRTHQDVPWRQYRDLNTYGYFPEGGYYYRQSGPRSRGDAADGVIMMAEAAPAGGEKERPDTDISMDKKETDSVAAVTAVPPSPPPLRSALDETVFFYPQVTTDEKGQMNFLFKMKEGLTRWKFQALAHTKLLAYGLTSAEVVTQKKLMVFPNPPRFFRAGDTIAFQIKVTNLADVDQKGSGTLKILDAFTNEDVSAKWKLINAEKPVTIAKGGSTPVAWTLEVPRDWTRPVKYQVYAKAGAFTDGEESLVPVVTNRVLVTESLPLPVKANETRTFVFKSMLEKNSATLDPHQYVVEMTSSPAWYAVQALPYLMEYPHECAEQIFSHLYANSLASHIAGKYPVIHQVYEGWRKSGDDALVSNLQKNQDLKSAMLEETPWVRDAMGETAQKKDIALLFEPNRLRLETTTALDRLRQMQLSNGGFPWFPGGRDSWYITQYITEGFGHLHKMGVELKGGQSKDIIEKTIPYLDARMIEWYDELQRMAQAGKIKLEDHHASSMQVHYLYTRSFYPDVQHVAKLDEVINYVKGQIEKYWLHMGMYEQGLAALASYRMWPDAPVSKEILASLRERTIVHDELGRYWKMQSGYRWNESAIEMQSLMVELYQDMKVPQAEVDELRVWLLKQKQTTRWKSTKATASAIYALLIHPDTWLESKGIVEVTLGKTSVINETDDTEAGTGYVRKSWSGDEIQSDWSDITVANPNKHIAWGSAYWQYWEDIDKVKSSVDHNPLKVTKTLLIARNTATGEQTVPADVKNLAVGDKLIVRITVETDRAMEFIHLKDLRASGFEPMDVLSGYRWGGGVGYYQSTKDLATHFFIDHLPRGKYVIEYAVTVAQAGDYSDGMASVQCMYAPEFGTHSSGQRVSVQ
jgi:uncharacterized protein YfaS (alpha-2-macroglobulin family)